MESNGTLILPLICRESQIWVHTMVKSIHFLTGKCRCTSWHGHQITGGQGAHYFIQLSLSILAYEMDITPIITSSKQCDCELKLLAQTLTHSKYSINTHRYHCIICYHHCYYIENFTGHFPLPRRMLLGTTCLYLLLFIFEILRCMCVWGAGRAVR